MASLLETLTGQIGGENLKQISRAIGTDESQAGAATGAALSTLIGALARNSAQEDGAQALHRAVAKDHSGSLLDNLGGFLGQAQEGAGQGILRHVLGSKQSRVEAGLAETTGMDKSSMGKLLTMLAPVVLGAIGKQQQQGNLDSNSLSRMLNQERQEIERKEPKAVGLLGSLLDTDGDGDVDMGDLAKHGAGMLGKLFKG